MTMKCHPLRWVFSRGLNATDIGYPLWMLWVVLALNHVPGPLRKSNPFYRRTESLAPLGIWILVAALLSVAVIACALAHRYRALYWLYIGLAVWWALLAGVSYSIGSGWLGLGFFVVFGVWALVRQAQIGAAMRQARNKP